MSRSTTTCLQAIRKLSSGGEPNKSAFTVFLARTISGVEELLPGGMYTKAFVTLALGVTSTVSGIYIYQKDERMEKMLEKNNQDQQSHNERMEKHNERMEKHNEKIHQDQQSHNERMEKHNERMEKMFERLLDQQASRKWW